MAYHNTEFGSAVTFPDGIDLEELPVGASSGALGVRGPLSAESLSSLLEDAGFTHTEAIQLSLAPDAAPIKVEPVEMDVPVLPQQHAVVLVERDGVLTWRYPESDLGGGDVRSGVRLHFRLDPVPEATDQKPDTRGWLHDLIADWLGHAVRVYVLRYAARAAVAQAAPFLERHLSPGLVQVTELDPSKWTHGALPEGGQQHRKILLLVHGTFSSTKGSFGALCSTEGGRGFLAAVFAKYDLVLGFDHRTLTEDPLRNAEDLAAALATLDLAPDAEFDAIAFSRGGLVLRLLTEHLLPLKLPVLRACRQVFVGCTNGGTNLAQPRNWKRMLDLYTNLALAGTRAAGWIPGFGTGAALVSETIKSISAFVQDLAISAIDESGVPGIAAMQPGSAVVRMLNDTGVSEFQAANARYYWAGVAFDVDQGSAPGFVNSLQDYLLYQAASELFKEPNDLVVDCAMMETFGKHTVLLKQHCNLSPVDRIYHTTYFTSPELYDCLGEWLLDRPDLFSQLRSSVQVIDGDTEVLDASPLLGDDALAPVVILERRNTNIFYHLRRTDELRQQLAAAASVAGEDLLSAIKKEVTETLVEHG